MTTHQLETRCCIAGGGPAGIMLGYLLARAGIEVIVLEKWPDFFRDFRGDTIHPSTMDILKELGLLDEFLTLPHSEMERMTIHFGKTEVTVADLRHVPAACKFIAFMPQWDFLTFLATKGKAYPSFHLMMETEVTDLVEENGRVVGLKAVGKENGSEEAYEIRADLVVGADGRHSIVREKGEFKVEELGAPIDVLWFRIGKSGTDDKQSLGYLNRGAGLIMLDRADYWQCAFIIEKGKYEEVKARGLEAFRTRIANLAGLSEEVLAEVDSWDKVKFLSVSVDHVQAWAREGLVLIGDAAHAMSPIGGVGINYAVQDAVAAANILIPAFTNETNAPSLALLQKIQARRAHPALRMQRLQVFIQDKILSPVLHARGDIRAPWFMYLLTALPILRRIPARIIGIGFQPEHVSNRTS